MKIEKNAQSTLETIAVLVLVMVGIMAIGPNVVRSINAFFKGAQEQAEDSFREEFTQANLVGDEYNYDLGDCDCSYDPNHVCGDGEYCARNRWEYPLINCSAACKTKYKDYDLPLALCDDEDPLATQGRLDFFDPSCYPTSDDYPLVDSDADFQAALQSKNCGWVCCQEAVPVSPPQCGTTPVTKGRRLMAAQCGPNLEVQYYWATDTAYCLYQCTGTKDVYSSWCDPTGYNYNLTADTAVKFVSFEEGTVDGCEAYALSQGCPAGDTDCYTLEQKCVVRCPNSDGVVGNETTGCACDATTHQNYIYTNGDCLCSAVNYYLGDCKYDASNYFICNAGTVQIIWGGATILSTANATTYNALCVSNGFYDGGTYLYQRAAVDTANATRFWVCRTNDP